MKPTTCPTCHGNDLAYGEGWGGFYFFLNFFQRVHVTSAVCMACGAVIPYLNDQALDKVRSWNGFTEPVDEL